MEKRAKDSIFSKCIKSARVFFGVGTIFILLFLILGQIIFPDERDFIFAKCEVFEAQWYHVPENGEKVAVEVPGKVEAEYGEKITLVSTLPQGIYNGENLCFRTIWQDVEIYIDGELRQSYNTNDSRPFGINSAMRYIFVDLQEEDAGKEIMYRASSKSKYAGDIREILVGDRIGIWIQFLQESGARTLIAVSLMMLSMGCVIVCAVVRIVYKKRLAINYLAWTLFFGALWMISEIEFRQLVFKNVSILSSVTYWCLMMIPITFVLYINEIQNSYYEKIFFVPLLYSTLMTVTLTILQFFDIVQFVEALIFMHIGIGLAVITIVGTLIVDTIKRRYADYFLAGIGVYGMLLATVLEVVLYYINVDLSLGTVLAGGLLFLFVMAVIKTGQDLLRSEQKKQQAILARKAQAKFLANMSHEIRTPINAIIGMNEMILRENDNKVIEDYAYNIQSASDMLLRLVNDVLDFSKIESGQLELVEDAYNLAELIQDEILLLKARAAGKPISIKIDIDSKLPTRLWGDELRIKQILTNLLSNAVKYTKEGMVTLKAFFSRIDNENIVLEFEVIDTGIGIRQEDLSKLFDSFKRLELNKNRNIQGTGLGLNIAKMLVDLMHGKINVQSEYEKGSTFSVAIPQRVIDNQQIGDFEATLKKNRVEKNTAENLFVAPEANVLVVDDNEMNLALIKGLLKRTQIHVDAVSSGIKGYKVSRKKKYDIIFMDHMMPDLDGIETLKMIREDKNNPNCDGVVIALTANAIAGCREMYLESGFNDYFSKPIQADKLDELLIKYLPTELVQRVGKQE